jgi:hypothetical protein
MALIPQKPSPTQNLPSGSQFNWSLCTWIDNIAKGASLPEDWTVAWQPKRIGSDYAAVATDGTLYALVIQGTHGSTDWHEDLDCETWTPFAPVSSAMVATGANQALTDMLANINSTGQSLSSYLQSISGLWTASTPLIITGHSLGGTLTALAACWIAYQYVNGQQALSTLPTSIQAMSFAPFAAGNSVLADFLNGSSNYVPCLNQNDAVPHAWAWDTTVNPLFNTTNLLNNLFPAPGFAPMPDGKLKTTIENKVTEMQNNNVSYVQTVGQYSYQFNYPSKPEHPNKFDKKLLWDNEVDYQHNTAYDNTFAASNAASAYAGQKR